MTFTLAVCRGEPAVRPVPPTFGGNNVNNSLITIKHFREGLERLMALVGEVASTATGALTDLEEAKMDKPAFFTATLTSTEWSDNAGEESAGAGYPYVYNLMAADAAAADGAECILAPASQEAACSCGMSPTVEVLDGMIRFYARSLPAENMTMQVRLIPGAPEQEG